MQEACVYIKDYTKPGSDDSAEGIRRAIQDAIHNNINRIQFEEGTYYLKTTVKLDTEGMMHDADSLEFTDKDTYLAILGTKRLHLLGAVDEKGDPKTILSGHNPGQLNAYLPSILWCEHNEQLTVSNIAFTRNPEFGSSGKVIGILGNRIWIEVTEGNHLAAEMGTYCINQFDPELNLLGESLSYGKGLNTTIKHVRDRIVCLEDEIATRVAVGNYLSWHQGARTDFQVYFYECNDLKLINVRTINANGFAMLAESCHNINADRVQFRPRESHRFVAPRDAWKLFKCTGSITMNHLYIEGVRMDGQNVQSNWLIVRELLSEYSARFYCKYTKKELIKNSAIEFYQDSKIERRQIKNWKIVRKEDIGYLYDITLTEPIPEYVRISDYCSAACWEPREYVCLNSKFVNIAGAGHLLRADHVTILNCLYKNTMNSAILLGAELSVHNEGGHATDVLIRGCEFDNSGFVKRYSSSEPACIGIDSAGFSEPCNKDIYIIGNTFRNSETAIFVRDAEKVYILNNKYDNIETELKADPKTTRSVTVK